MGTGSANTLIMASYDDLRKLINEDFAELKVKSFISRFDNVLIGTNEVANMHNINPRTVMNYIKDGLIVPEMKIGDNDHHQFRLSYALTLDFKELQKKLRAKNKGW